MKGEHSKPVQLYALETFTDGRGCRHSVIRRAQRGEKDYRSADCTVSIVTSEHAALDRLREYQKANARGARV